MNYAQLVASAARNPITINRGDLRAILAEANKSDDELQVDVDAQAARNRAADMGDDESSEANECGAYLSLVYAMHDHVCSDGPMPVSDDEAEAILAQCGKTVDDLFGDVHELIAMEHRESMAAAKLAATVAQAKLAARAGHRLAAWGY